MSETARAWRQVDKDAIVQGTQALLDNSGVICLTDTPLDNRMWEEYAGMHKCICVCFETFASPFPTIESIESPFSAVYSVNYVPTHPTVGLTLVAKSRLKLSS